MSFRESEATEKSIEFALLSKISHPDSVGVRNDRLLFRQPPIVNLTAPQSGRK